MKCNSCTLKNLKRLALANGQVVTLRDDKAEGIRVYVHAPNVEPNEHEHVVVWFMKLSDRCCC